MRDPIELLGELAVEYDIGLHVDTRYASFYLPFLAEDHPETVSFKVPGVTSITTDMGKTGLAMKGVAVTLYRSFKLRKYQYLLYPKWSGGHYGTPGIAGSKSGGILIGAWSTIVSIGKEGYKERQRRVFEDVRKLRNDLNYVKGIDNINNTVKSLS